MVINMKFALIGCGRIAVNHIKAVVNNDLDMVAVCDLIPEAIDALFEKTGYTKPAKRYTDYKTMIAENPDLELVAVATESGVHAEIALYCIDHGINVIVEKPMAMSMADADEIVRRSLEKDVRSLSASRTASMLLSSGPAKPWNPAGLAGFPMAPSMSAGTGTGTIMTRPPGAVSGPLTAAACSTSASTALICCDG